MFFVADFLLSLIEIVKFEFSSFFESNEGRSFEHQLELVPTFEDKYQAVIHTHCSHNISFIMCFVRNFYLGFEIRVEIDGFDIWLRYELSSLCIVFSTAKLRGG